MNFWFFTLIMNLLIPIIMIVYGIIFEKKTPPIAKSRFAFGYRTSMSMKSKDTWDYAHKFFGKLWFRYGIIICALSIIALLFVLGDDEKTVGITGIVICYVQLLVMILPIIPTEISLRKKFDKNGNKRGKTEKK